MTPSRTEWLEFEVVSVERPDLDYRCNNVDTRRWTDLVCVLIGPRHLEDYSFNVIYLLSFPRTEHRLDTG